MISQANSVRDGVGKMCDTRWSTSFFSHLFLNCWKKESLIIRPNVDPKVVSFDGIDKAYMWLCVKCAPFLFFFALLPDLNKWIWRQTTLTTHPYQRDAEKIPKTKNWRREVNSALEKYFHMLRKGTETNLFSRPLTLKRWSVVSLGKVFHLLTAFPVSDGMKGTWPLPSQSWSVLNSPVSLYFVWLCLKWALHNDLQISSLRRKVKIAVKTFY